MPDVRAIAAAYGVRVETADLGDWGSVTLLAEYDPDGPVIRLNERASWRILRQAQGDTRQAQGDTRQAQGDTDVQAGGHVTLSLSKGAPPRYAASTLAHTADHAIAHELYHHREAIGEVARIADRAARERAADAYADELLGGIEAAR